MAGFVCDVDERYRSACKRLNFYDEHDGKQYCVLHFPTEEKEANTQFRDVLDKKLEDRDFDFSGVYFSSLPEVFSRFTFEYEVAFSGAIFEKVANFSGSTFEGETSFSESTFKSGADFSDTIFRAETDFSRVTAEGEATRGTSFIGSIFDAGVSFYEATFKGFTTFSRATFKGNATFMWTNFEGYADFWSVSFKASAIFVNANFELVANFYEAIFEEAAHFNGAVFRERTRFYGLETFNPKSVVTFRNALIEEPERFSLHTIRLRPSWFINVDARKLNFTNVQWYGFPKGPSGGLEGEIEATRRGGIYAESPHTILAKACRELSLNAEENQDYPIANEFHCWSMEALRIGRWRYLGWLRQFIKKNWRRINARFGPIATLLWIWRILRREPLRHTMPSRFGLVPTFYGALSGYGVRAGRAFLVLVGMLLAFAVMYTCLGPNKLDSIQPAVVYSLLALARLNPEPVPEGPGLFQFLVGLEGILGPLQIALLALAIRRKVMR
jgi:uncharacterized protein YjbI with pentapeptide repeats